MPQNEGKVLIKLSFRIHPLTLATITSQVSHEHIVWFRICVCWLKVPTNNNTEQHTESLNRWGMSVEERGFTG